MIVAWRPALGPGNVGLPWMGRGRQSFRVGATMTWETPKAIDFRFGMEITMYVFNR